MAGLSRPKPADHLSRLADRLSCDHRFGHADEYRSSDGVIRRFCGKCGSSLSFEADGMVFMSLGSLDAPEHVVVERHCYTKARLPGIELADGLPQFPGPFGGKGGRPVD